MILYNNIVEISKNRWIGYMLKVAFLMASSILFNQQGSSYPTAKLTKLKEYPQSVFWIK